MNNKSLFQLPLHEISTLEQFVAKWKSFFKKSTLPKEKGPFYLYLKLEDNKEIHLADLHQHPVTLSPLAISLVFDHWQTYHAYYTPLSINYLLFYV